MSLKNLCVSVLVSRGQLTVSDRNKLLPEFSQLITNIHNRFSVACLQHTHYKPIAFKYTGELSADFIQGKIKPDDAYYSVYGCCILYSENEDNIFYTEFNSEYSCTTYGIIKNEVPDTINKHACYMMIKFIYTSNQLKFIDAYISGKHDRLEDLVGIIGPIPKTHFYLYWEMIRLYLTDPQIPHDLIIEDPEADPHFSLIKYTLSITDTNEIFSVIIPSHYPQPTGLMIGEFVSIGFDTSVPESNTQIYMYPILRKIMNCIPHQYIHRVEKEKIVLGPQGEEKFLSLDGWLYSMPDLMNVMTIYPATEFTLRFDSLGKLSKYNDLVQIIQYRYLTIICDEYYPVMRKPLSPIPVSRLTLQLMHWRTSNIDVNSLLKLLLTIFETEIVLITKWPKIGSITYDANIFPHILIVGDTY